MAKEEILSNFRIIEHGQTYLENIIVELKKQRFVTDDQLNETGSQIQALFDEIVDLTMTAQNINLQTNDAQLFLEIIDLQKKIKKNHKQISTMKENLVSHSNVHFLFLLVQM